MYNGNDFSPDREVNGNDKYGYLRNLDTARLQAMLQQESFLNSGGKLDVDLIRHISAILDEREPLTQEPDAELSLKAFKEEIIPYIEKENTEANPASLAPAVPRRMSIRRRYTTVLIAAIVSILLGGTLFASAFGQNLWLSFIRWGKGTFQIGPQAQVTSDPLIDSPEVSPEFTIFQPKTEEYQTLDEAIDAMGPDVLALKWIPDGFELKTASVTKGRQNEHLSALYEAGDNTLLYNVSFYTTGNANIIFEIGENSVEPINIAGNSCYLVTNISREGIIWIDEEVIYHISGNVDRDTLIKMVESIYEGEA